MKGDENDPRGVIREAYRMEGIGAGDCRSIFLDWALGLPAEPPPETRIAALLGQYAPDYPDHPMTDVLRAGLERPAAGGRRGGWAARRGTRR